jgi:Protein of unknown function (DUF4038)/Putative collagen-binding domain of a collagenase
VGRRLLAASLCGLILGCSSATAPSSGELTIRPGSVAVAPGSTQQFAVTGDVQVIWGLTETRIDAPVADDVAYPVTVSDDGRFLLDQAGRPWRVQADAGWLMSVKATPAQVDEYLATRRAQGFNSFYLHAMVHPGGYAAAPNAPENVQGDSPFAEPGNFSTAGASPESERYWAWIDTIVDKAAAHGMVVMLAYTYLGWEGGDQGWYQEVLAQPSQSALFDWGRWLGNRYKDDANLIWFGLGDYSPPDGSEGALRVRAIADGIRAAGARQLFMAEPSNPDQIPGEVADFAAVVDQNSFYGYGPRGDGTVYETADRAWRLSPTKPAWMQEGTYEFENNTGGFTGQPWETRRGRFWSVLAGGTAGDGFGSRDAWQWQNFPDALASPGAAYSTYAFELFGALPWWQLRPSGTEPGRAGRLILAGEGTWGTADYITSALTENGDWLLAYVPVVGSGARSFEVAMTSFSGTARARWFDPASGTYLAISDGYEYTNEGTRTFTTPGLRGDGTDDWLLVVDTTAAAHCGTISTGGLYTAPVSAPPGLTCRVTATAVSDPSMVESVELRVD